MEKHFRVNCTMMQRKQPSWSWSSSWKHSSKINCKGKRVHMGLFVGNEGQFSSCFGMKGC